MPGRPLTSVSPAYPRQPARSPARAGIAKGSTGSDSTRSGASPISGDAACHGQGRAAIPIRRRQATQAP